MIVRKIFMDLNWTEKQKLKAILTEEETAVLSELITGGDPAVDLNW